MAEPDEVEQDGGALRRAPLTLAVSPSRPAHRQGVLEVLGGREPRDEVVARALVHVAEVRAPEAPQGPRAEAAGGHASDRDGPRARTVEPGEDAQERALPFPDAPATAVTVPLATIASIPRSAWTSPVALR